MKNVTLHLLWVVGVLILAIIAIVTYLPDGDKIREFVSFAAAISSIILALVAIIYSMISNKGIDQSLSEVRASANAIAQETSRLNTASQGLSKEADEAIRRLGDLPHDFQKMSGELGSKIDNALSASLPDRVGSQVAADSTENQLDPSGRPVPLSVALYAMHISHVTQQPLRVEEIYDESDKAGRRFADYMRGVLDTTKLANRFNIEIEGVFGVYQVRSLGILDLSILVRRVENPADNAKEYSHHFNAIRRAFDLEEIAAESELDDETKSDSGKDSSVTDDGPT